MRILTLQLIDCEHFSATAAATTSRNNPVTDKECRISIPPPPIRGSAFLWMQCLSSAPTSAPTLSSTCPQIVLRLALPAFNLYNPDVT